MACFATPCGLPYAGHCFNRAHAQQSGPALIPAGGKLGVTSYVKQRKAFGQTLFDFQNTQFTLAEVKTSIEVGWAFYDQCLAKVPDRTLTMEDAAMVKLWTTENNSVVIDKCLQLFGGWGYMSEYPISRLYVDSRVRRIYGGTSEVCKMIIGRSL